MAFVRKRGNSHQLIEKFRDEQGRSRQRTVTNLGPHETPEKALAAAERDLRRTRNRLQERKNRVSALEATIRETWGEALEKHHASEIPTREEVEKRALEDLRAQQNQARAWATSHDEWDEIVGDISDYVMGFTTHGPLGTVDITDFIVALRKLEERQAEADKTHAEFRELKSRVKLLEEVVVSR